MALLVEVNPGSPEERYALGKLEKLLPTSWIVTTNISERNFLGLRLRKMEVDCLLLAPLGIFVLDFKDHRGTITPSQNGEWKRDGVPLNETNPFDQMRKNIFGLKKLIKKKVQTQTGLWIEGIIVFTHDSVELDWGKSDIDDAELKRQVVRIPEVEASVRALASTKRISKQLARSILLGLKPRELPSNVLDHPDWQEENASNGRSPPLGSSPQLAQAAIDSGLGSTTNASPQYGTVSARGRSALSDYEQQRLREAVSEILVCYADVIRLLANLGFPRLELDRGWYGAFSFSEYESIERGHISDKSRKRNEAKAVLISVSRALDLLSTIKMLYCSNETDTSTFRPYPHYDVVLPKPHASVSLRQIHEHLSLMQSIANIIARAIEKEADQLFLDGRRELAKQRAKLFLRNYNTVLSCLDRAAELGHTEAKHLAARLRSWGAPTRRSRFE